jgi:hypothetical protein
MVSGFEHGVHSDGMKGGVSAPRDSRGTLGVLTSTTKEAPVSESYAGRQVVGIDLHRRRSVIVRMTEAGERRSASSCPRRAGRSRDGHSNRREGWEVVARCHPADLPEGTRPQRGGKLCGVRALWEKVATTQRPVGLR